MNFTTVWDNILNHQGEIFYTITGKKFKYEVVNNHLIITRINEDGTEHTINQNIPKSDVEQVFDVLDTINGPGGVNNTVRGPSYIYAILTDPIII